MNERVGLPPGSVAGASATPGAGAGAAAGASGATSGGAGVFGNSMAMIPNLPMGTGTGMDDCIEATVAFVIDGSGSMCDVFGGSTRWGELRGALLAPDTGLIQRLETRARFGMLLYDGSIDLGLAGMATGGSPTPACAGGGALGRGNAMECMQLVEVPAALGNYAAINTMFPMRELGGSTPTDRALNYQVDQLLAAQDAGQDLTKNPQYIILATDGQPNDICVGGAGGDGTAQQQAVLAAVDRAVQRSIKTFVISLAGTDPALQAHLDDVARHGDPGNPAARTFNPSTPQDLVDTLTSILGRALGCVLE